MPRKRPESDQNFYEFLTSTAESLNLPWLKNRPDYQTRFDARLQRISRLLSSAIITARPVAKAVLADLYRYAKSFLAFIASKSARKLYLLTLAVTASIGLLLATSIASATYAVYSGDLASPAMLLAKKDTGTTILDRQGKVLYRVYGANNRKLVEISQIPQSLIEATLAAEDPGFYEHPGFSWRGTSRALIHDISNRGKLQGGSTITQQLVKNALLSHDKSFTRKYQEVLLAIELERRYDKDDIMQMYLNEIYYGQGSYGIESASQTYFHKSSKDLTLSESALLAGLPLCPSTCDPNVSLEAATGRRNYILSRMRELGLITNLEHAAAQKEPIQANARQVEIHAPHFVFYVLDQLAAQYGKDTVERGGITVYTTLDLDKQEIGERLVAEQVAGLKSYRASNGALIAMEPATGEIISMVGSINFNEPNFGNVNVTLSERQPGSSFKPFAYLTAFKKGWNGATTVDDLPLNLPSGDGTAYIPKNYDGRFRGRNITLRRALSNSLNIPAVNVLRFAGIHETIQTAKDMGITTLNDESRYGLSLVLGGGEVRMIDMATAYSTLANGGTKVPSKSILKVLDRYGKDITKAPAVSPQSVLDPRHAYMMTHLLSDNQSRAEIFGTNSPLNLSPHIAFVKTGTTNDWRDNWTAGGTVDLITVTWVGNNDNSSMSNIDGITGAAPIWHRYLRAVLGSTPPKPFPQPAGITTLRVCTQDGGIANPWDKGIDEIFPSESAPTRRCSSERPKTPEELQAEAEKKAQDEMKKQLDQVSEPNQAPTSPNNEEEDELEDETEDSPFFPSRRR
jgi:1A family penicillin-binding protein